MILLTCLNDYSQFILVFIVDLAASTGRVPVSFFGLREMMSSSMIDGFSRIGLLQKVQ